MRDVLKSLLIGSTITFMAASCAFAAYPERPVTMIVGYGAGGVTDIMARALSNLLSKEMKGNIVVKNVVGAAGTIGAAELSNSKPDGYTLICPSAPWPRSPTCAHCPTNGMRSPPSP